MPLENVVDRLAWCSVATNLQFVKKHNKLCLQHAIKRSIHLSLCQRPPGTFAYIVFVFIIILSNRSYLLFRGEQPQFREAKKFFHGYLLITGRTRIQTEVCLTLKPGPIASEYCLTWMCQVLAAHSGSSLRHAESFFAVQNSLVAARGLSSFRRVGLVALQHMES